MEMAVRMKKLAVLLVLLALMSSVSLSAAQLDSGRLKINGVEIPRCALHGEVPRKIVKFI